jgi:hypothetical protein
VEAERGGSRVKDASGRESEAADELLQQSSLPALDTFSEDEQLFARVVVEISRNERAAMFRGRLVEAHVARVLGPGTRFAPLGTWPYDLMTENGVRIEVKTGSNEFRITASERHGADVWILVPTGEWSSEPEHRYLVAHPEFVGWARARSDTISVGRARSILGEVTEADLAAAVALVTEGVAGLPPEPEAPLEIEPIDRIPNDPELTRWRRAARAHQIRWRQVHGWPAGTMAIPARAGGGTRVLANSLDEDFGPATGANFLSDSVRAAVAHRLKHRQKGETLNTRRLYCNLLSSMPMCFNLFGQLHGDPAASARAAHQWFPDLCAADAPTTIGFEWSPARSSTDYTGDRTAFDAVVHVGGNRPALIGIETKYHEAPERQRSHAEVKPSYEHIVEATGMFDGDTWRHEVAGTELEQIWRDHLLALAYGLRDVGLDRVRYVLLAPSANPAWSRLAGRYGAMLTPPVRDTFEFRAIETMLDAVDPPLPDASAFASRYLDVVLPP